MDINKKSFFHPHNAVIITSNLFSAIFFIQNGLPFFLLLYAFWLDSIILAAFEVVEILLSKNHKYSTIRLFFLAVRFFIIRISILLFYAIFMITFYLFLFTKKEDLSEIYLAVYFKNYWFNASILSFTISHLFQLVFGYILSKKYLTNSPTNYISFFSARTLALHVIIVLGAFVYKFFESKFNNPSYGEFSLIFLFITIKTISDMIIFALNKNETETQPMI
jgi:hypothetical protein